ncbi:solute carrier family 22 member 7-like [Protopterus annectens]|uniref:solute carrier family 22 member 7-like n=1 Tax=Protopterus annectens TaxID=7888 RepID=UPI001CF9A498|nr:solute carrier family 22 member 7-like [Protopterus annectens]
MSKTQFRFEDLLEDVGNFGRFQKMTLSLLCFADVILPLHFLLNNFLAAVPSHHCSIPVSDTLKNLTKDDLLTISIPRKSDGTLSSCEMFSEPQLYLLSNTSQAKSNSSSVKHCQDGWEYDRNQFISTTTTEFNLVCNSKGLNQATVTFFFIGLMLGAFLFGFLVDKYGRRKMLVVAYFISAICGTGAAFSTSFISFAILRSMTGVSMAGLSLIPITLGVEWVGIRYRTLSSITLSLCWSLGNTLLALIAYFIRDWHWLMLAVTVPCYLGIILCWWTPESARWLITKGENKVAFKYLSKCANMNKKTRSIAVSEEVLRKVVVAENVNKHYTFVDLFKTSAIRKLALCSGTVWFGVAFAYYGISLNITGFVTDMYLTHLIYGLVEFPAKLLTYFFLAKIGRRCWQSSTLLVTGLCIGINIFIPKNLGYVRSIIAAVGKGFSEASFCTAFLYTSELYPTVIRQNGLGFSSFIGRLGVSAAPLVKLLEDIWQPFPDVIYGTAAIISGIVAFLLPETLNANLPETIDDIEKQRYGKQSSCTSSKEDANVAVLKALKPLNPQEE